MALAAVTRPAAESDEECIHGMTRAWCEACRPRPDVDALSSGEASPHGGRSRQRLLDDLCDLLGVARYVAGPGSSPQRVFAAAAERADVAPGPMTEVGAAIATKAGLTWGPECDNRHRRHSATAVTRDGVGVVVQALGILAAR